MTMRQNDDQCNFDLPEELFATHILARLPTKTLIRFKSVSKSWNSIISSPDFARLQCKKTAFSDREQHLLINPGNGFFLSFDYASYEGGHCRVSKRTWDCSPFNDIRDTFDNKKLRLARILKSSIHTQHHEMFIVESCDGLVCLKDAKSRSLYLLNPTTLEHRQIPYPQTREELNVVWGFGYVSSTDDYNIVRICQNQDNNEKEIQVFSLMNDNWTSSQEQVNGYGYRPRLSSIGVTVDDVTYYAIHNADEPVEVGWFIIGFDLVAKKFIKVPLPHWRSGAFDHPPLMCDREGCLCVCWTSNDWVLEIGMLEQCGGTGSWTKLFCIRDCDLVNAVRNNSHREMPGVTNKGRFVFHVDDYDIGDHYRSKKATLMLVDPEKEPPENVHELRVPRSINLCNYIQTLISPYAAVKLTKRSQRCEKKED